MAAPASVAAALNSQITVTYPNGGETLTVGAPLTIAWSHLLPTNTSFTADVSFDGGATWVPTNSSVSGAGSTASLTWTVGGSPSTRARIRVRTADGSVSDQSNADFTIASAASTSTSTSSTAPASCSGTCAVQVTSPNGGETWTWGTGGTAEYPVRWTSTYPATQGFDVNFSADGGATWTRVTSTTGTGITVGASSSSVRWIPPFTEQGLFNVTPSGRSGGDTSDAAFHIRKPVAMLSPNGGETLTLGTDVDVRFTWAYDQQVPLTPALQVSYDGGTTWADARTSGGGPSTGTSRYLRWTVVGPPATRTRLRVNAVSDSTSSFGGAQASDDSDADFTLAESATPASAGTVQVTSPNGGETWTWGTDTVQGYAVRWTSTYPATQGFDVNFSGDGGATWTRVTSTTGTGITVGASSSSVRWIPPYTEQGLFNVTPSGQSRGDTSDAAFHVRKPVAILSPNGGETLTLGSLVNVSFTWVYSQQSTFSPALQVSYDGGATWTNARTEGGGYGTGTTRSLQWTAVGPPATRTRLRVIATGSTTSSFSDTVVSDDSDADFTLAESATPAAAGTVQVTSPNGGETWTWGTDTVQGYAVRWTSTYPATQGFDVNFSGDGGATWTRVTSTTGTGITVGASSSSVRWVPPYTEQGLFNVTPSGQSRGDTSDAAFHVRKPVAILSPNGGETLTLGSLVNVSFTWVYSQQSTFSPALQVSYDGGATWTNARTEGGGYGTGTTRSLQWTAVGPPATRTRLRVIATGSTTSSFSDAVVSDDSDADFTLVLPSTP